jgi:hypothetical protein
MDYATLCTNIQDICENTFTADQLAMFTTQSEQKIYNTVQIPALRKTLSSALTLNNRLFTLPADFLYPFSFAVIEASGNYRYLLNKDANFIREAYPSPTAYGLPQHYGFTNEATIIVGPTPDSAYSIEFVYGHYPESIVTAGTTWLGDDFDSALLNGALVEAIRFMKGEPDMVQMYQTLYVQAIGLLKVLGDGKLRQDTYRSGQFRERVS